MLSKQGGMEGESIKVLKIENLRINTSRWGILATRFLLGEYLTLAAKKHIDPPQFGLPSSPLLLFTSGLLQDPVPLPGAKPSSWMFLVLDGVVNNGCVGCG